MVSQLGCLKANHSSLGNDMMGAKSACTEDPLQTAQCSGGSLRLVTCGVLHSLSSLTPICLIGSGRSVLLMNSCDYQLLQPLEQKQRQISSSRLRNKRTVERRSPECVFASAYCTMQLQMQAAKSLLWNGTCFYQKIQRSRYPRELTPENLLALSLHWAVRTLHRTLQP